MRVSVKKTPELIGKVNILCDLVDVTNRCVAADTEQGIVVCYKKDDTGKMVVESGLPVFEVIKGSVDIITKQPGQGGIESLQP